MKIIKRNPELIIIFLIGLILRIYYGQLDPYLHEWDERFHALVARNMVDNPFVPMLHKNPIVPYDLNSWCCNSVWLHKQPLFMWQMALSMKLFGTSEFIMRLPSILMGAVSILLVYRISSLLTNNKTTSLIASLLICFSQYQLEMISGQKGMDHNDVAFSFYILASFWAFSEKMKNEKIIWDILIGVFVGCAILNKWLAGILVYLPYGMFVIKQLLYKKEIIQLKKIVLSIICCLLICLPWQFYILDNFHNLAMFEYKYNSQHIFIALEGHVGGVLFYIKRFNEYFGTGIWIFMIIALFKALKSQLNLNSSINWALLISYVTVFSFFSFIVKTKLPSYFFIVVPFGIIYISIGIQEIIKLVNVNWFTYVIISFAVILTLFPYKSITLRKNNQSRENLIYNTNIYKSLKTILPSYVKTVINMNSFEDIDVMFYNNDLTAYHWWIDVKELDSLKKKKIWIGAFKNHGDYNLPIEYNNYPYLHIIDTLLK